VGEPLLRVRDALVEDVDRRNPLIQHVFQPRERLDLAAPGIEDALGAQRLDDLSHALEESID
jgi:hypothetical protein